MVGDDEGALLNTESACLREIQYRFSLHQGWPLDRNVRYNTFTGLGKSFRHSASWGRAQLSVRRGKRRQCGSWQAFTRLPLQPPDRVDRIGAVEIIDFGPAE